MNLTSTSRLTTPVDLRLGFFLRWFEGCRVDGEAGEGDAGLELVVAVMPDDDVMVTDGTSTFSTKVQFLAAAASQMNMQCIF